jgi:hypothetical protein
MPEWSELPWATIITALVAVYGAVLSTVNLIMGWRRDRLTTGEGQRRQAEQVSGWLVTDDGPVEPNKLFYGLVLQNGSSQPVHELIASIVTTQGSGRRTAVGDPRQPVWCSFVGSIPPGQTRVRIEQPGQGMMRRYGIELAFQDAGGFYWLRRGDGALKQVDRSPVDLYGIPRPVGWMGPHP